jgi:hypothetical protein
MNLTDDIIYGYMQPTDINNVAAAALRRHMGSLARAIVGPLLISCTAVICYFAIAFPTFFVTTASSNQNQQFMEVIVGGIGGVFVLLAILAASLGYAIGLVCRTVTLELTDRSPAFRQVEDDVNRKLPKIMVTVILALLPTVIYLLIALALTIGPGISEDSKNETLLGALAVLGILLFLAAFAVVPLLMMRGAIAIPILLEEEVSPMKALRRSRELMRSKSGETPMGVLSNLWMIGIFLVVAAWLGLGTLIAVFDIEGWFRPISGSDWLEPLVAYVLAVAPILLASTLLVVIWCSSLSALYVERRMRLEGLDVMILKRRAEDAQKRSRFRH